MLEGASVSPAVGCTGAPPLVPLMGFIGPSGKDGRVRIYRDLTFRSYYDLASDALASVDASDDPETPSAFFLAADASATLVEDETECAEAGFLGGSISRGRLGAPVPEGAAAPTPDGFCQNTAYPTFCTPNCITLYTAYPTSCPPTGTTVADIGANAPLMNAPQCITLWTAYPSWCPPTATTGTAYVAGGPPICLTVVTAYPSWCAPTCANTGVPTSCG